ncbi:MAG: conjugal transfer protein TraX [Lachnospiraceae bacterium]|nr:conjugal transfer protein TraX [Lachnospiraceae bacterium]
MVTYNTYNSNNTSGRWISASVLKTIAIVTMFIDHFGYSVVNRWEQSVFQDIGPQGPITAAFRMIGRIAFILFAFLLVEGFANTSNRRKYVLRLLAGAVISEVPFDLISGSGFFNIWDQNIFFTLTIGFCTIWVLDVLRSRKYTGQPGTDRPETNRAETPVVNGVSRKDRVETIGGKRTNTVVITVLEILTVITGMALAELVRCDYGCMGVGLIVVFYLFRWRSTLFWAALIWSFIGHLITDFFFYLAGLYKYSLEWGESFVFPDWTSIRINMSMWIPSRLGYTMPGVVFALVLILRYNGEKGRQLPKVFYYLFYPVHLLLLYITVTLIW